MQLGVNIPDQRITVSYELGQTHYGRSCGVESHREENFFPCMRMKRATASPMVKARYAQLIQRSIEIRIRYG